MTDPSGAGAGICAQAYREHTRVGTAVSVADLGCEGAGGIGDVHVAGDCERCIWAGFDDVQHEFSGMGSRSCLLPV